MTKIVYFQCRMDYKHCFLAHRQQPTQQTLTKYIDSHNAYVQQVSGTFVFINQILLI